MIFYGGLQVTNVMTSSRNKKTPENGPAVLIATQVCAINNWKWNPLEYAGNRKRIINV
jgi:hypothetical protein